MIKTIILSLILLCTLSCFAQWHYPHTKTVDSADVYFGFIYKDPYRWLEDLKDPETEAWFKQQAGFSNSILEKISGRNELIAEWKKLDSLQSPKYESRIFVDGRIFYKKTMPGENVGKVYYRIGIEGNEHLLFDPVTYIKGKTLSVESIMPSYDGKKVIIAYSEGGAEISTIKILDVNTKQFLPETIYPSWFGPISWTFDNKSFTYFSQKTDDSKSLEFELNTKTKLHTLGMELKDDIDFFSNESYPDLNIQANDIPWATIEKDSKNYIFGYLGTVRPEINCLYAPISQINNKKIAWKELCSTKDKLVRDIEFTTDTIFAITYRDSPNYKLIATDLKDPDWENAKIVVNEKTETLEYLCHSKSYLFLVYSNGINNHLYKYNLKKEELVPIHLPFEGVVNIFCLDTKTNDCIVGITSWIKPYTEFNYDAEKNIFMPGTFNKSPNYPEAFKDLKIEETEVKGHDGVMIPLTIIFKNGTKLNGSNCCLMDGYGAYGSSMSPNFDIKLLSLAIKDVVIAIPHVRGGSEKGQTWYMSGYKTTKPNTWKDFISCAEYLIEKGYTSASKLAGTGTSAGGILISRAITERPDLFAAAICNVGDANAMRAEFTPNGPVNIPEFGSVKDSIECRSLYEMDGVQHVVIGTKYPAVICVGGWNDPRVSVWEPGKFAAAFQNASSSGKPVLLKVNYDNGHFTEDKKVTFANYADQYAFALWNCGHPDFQLMEKNNTP
jgi:prolyl oligopeptidase